MFFVWTNVKGQRRRTGGPDEATASRLAGTNKGTHGRLKPGGILSEDGLQDRMPDSETGR
jgi:hypothetical protein